MKNGFRIYDTDTHIDPGADVLEKLQAGDVITRMSVKP